MVVSVSSDPPPPTSRYLQRSTIFQSTRRLLASGSQMPSASSTVNPTSVASASLCASDLRNLHISLPAGRQAHPAHLSEERDGWIANEGRELVGDGRERLDLVGEVGRHWEGHSAVCWRCELCQPSSAGRTERVVERRLARTRLPSFPSLALELMRPDCRPVTCRHCLTLD